MLNKLILFSLLAGLAVAQSIKDYQIIHKCIQDQDHKVYQALRLYSKEGKAYYLVVDTSLQTRELLVQHTHSVKQCTLSHYERLKLKALANNKAIQNSGIVEGWGKGYALTVDMCPSSKKGFERNFFLTLIKKQKNFPVTISITGKWIRYHQEEFLQLLEWSKDGSLDVTWMNHGFMHPYQRGLQAQENFINLPGVDFDEEIIELEKLLLSYGVTPSIFYRFAGLVSTEDKVKKLVNKYGLIPLGSRAWIAKGEKIKEGSVVLVHGNKNEPMGIEAFLKESGKSAITLNEQFNH